MGRRKKNSRPSWDEYFLQISDLVSTRATCQRLKVGVILVKDRKIISTGYCGAPRKVPDCFEAGCLIRDGHCVRTVHAEANTVIQAAYHGISTKDSTLYSNFLPCYNCVKILINAGIEKIVFRRIYRPDKETEKILKQAKIKLVQIKDKTVPKVVLGFVGLPCAGKREAIDYLTKKHGFFYSSTSDRIREEIQSQGKKITRLNLQKIGGELRNKFGPDILARRTWEKILSSGEKKVVIDSIRGKEEVEFFRRVADFCLVAILADPRKRFERMKKRGREADPKTWEEFKKMEARDKTGDGRDVEACIEMADFKVENNGTIEELENRIEKVLKRLPAKNK